MLQLHSITHIRDYYIPGAEKLDLFGKFWVKSKAWGGKTRLVRQILGQVNTFNDFQKWPIKVYFF